MLDGTGVAPTDPRVNMLHADLTGLPPIMVYYGSHELLVWETVEFAKRARSAGVDVCSRSPRGSTISCSVPAACLKWTSPSRRWRGGFDRSFVCNTINTTGAPIAVKRGLNGGLQQKSAGR